MTMYAIKIEVDGDGVSFTGPDYGDGTMCVCISFEQIPAVIRELNRILEDYDNV